MYCAAQYCNHFDFCLNIILCHRKFYTFFSVHKYETLEVPLGLSTIQSTGLSISARPGGSQSTLARAKDWTCLQTTDVAVQSPNGRNSDEILRTVEDFLEHSSEFPWIGWEHEIFPIDYWEVCKPYLLVEYGSRHSAETISESKIFVWWHAGTESSFNVWRLKKRGV